MKLFVPSQFSVIRALQEDSNSKTFLATDHFLEREDVVVKIVRKGLFSRDRDHLLNRISWFTGIRHDNLSIVFDAGLTPKGDLYFVREYLPSSEFGSAHSFTAIKALVSAIDFLQSNGRIHGAIKPSNIFFNDRILKLTDPNFMRSNPPGSEADIRFGAPEVLNGEKATLASDLYSLGAVLYLLLTRRNLFEDLDLSHLRTKYLWASPLPIGNLCDVPKPISDAVMQLLDKDPENRVSAFRLLKGYVGSRPASTTRAAYIDRQIMLKDAVEFLHPHAMKRLRLLLVEGTAGIGKSRLLEELRIRLSFEGVHLVPCCCLLGSPDFYPVLEGAHKVRVKFNPSHHHQNFGSFQRDDTTNREYPPGKLVSEVIGFLTSVAQETPLVLAIEGTDKADPGTLQFIEQLAFRAAEIPLSVVLTCRGRRSILKLCRLIEDCIAEDFRQIRLLPLSAGESQCLLGSVEKSVERQKDLIPLAGGNPLLLEEYARSFANKSVPTKRIKEALDWMRSEIPKQSKSVVEALSLVRKPAEMQTVAYISERSILELQQQLNALEAIGVIERCGDSVGIAYPDLAIQIYKRMSRRNRLRLAKRIFDVFSTTNTDSEDLAYYSFGAENFHVASRLYQQLARTAFEKQEHKKAVTYYERLQECETRGGSQFLPGEKLKLCRCYHFTGRSKQCRAMAEQLLSEVAVRSSPELLSEVYVLLAGTLDQTSPNERVRLSRLAIECLPPDSALLYHRYLAFCSRLLDMGDLPTAVQALERMSEADLSEKDLSHVNLARAIVLLNKADFKGSSESFLRVDRKYTDSAVILTNLALCFEHLGDLIKALEFQTQAQKLAIDNGIAQIKILSLDNLASIKTKLGEIREAELLFEQSFTSLENFREKEVAFDTAKFLALYYDAALHDIQLGRYRRAAEHLKSVRPFAGLVYEIDRVFCAMVQCQFYRDVGFPKKVRDILAKLQDSHTLKTPFFSVERTLLDARMPDLSNQEKLRRLQEALETTEQFGTLYQQCQVLNELAAVHVLTGDRQKAQEYSKRALQLARKQGYKLLAVRGLMLAGVASEERTGKEHKLLTAFQSASEMGLQELMAESAFHIGILHFEAGNLVTARDYLSRSISMTAKLAEEIPIRSRTNYLAVHWRREAREALERCNRTMREQSAYTISDVHDSLGDDRYFKATYRLALSAAAIKSADVLLGAIEEALRTSLIHGGMILLKGTTGSMATGIRIKPTDDVIRKAQSVASMAKNRMYFGSAEMARPKEIVAWIPLQSETWEGGIYVVCRQNETPLTEKEMELLAIIGTIANGALRGLEAHHAAETENRPLDEFYGMVGASKAMREVYSQIQIAARNTATVLIEGESGTGKELVAKAIHSAGPRAKNPFIAIDCGAIPESLIEAELFGAKKGSYTGAVADRQGLFEAANRGTLFLDEISNTTPALQAKLLRVIQEREVRRIGDTRDRPIDVRLIVASNMNLEALAGDGRFRKDLLYRLKVFDIKLPPLRARRDDIPMTAHAFLQKMNATNKLKKYFAPGVMNHLAAHNFPGNVRELQNAIERAFFSAKGSLISDVPIETQVELSAGHDEVQSWFTELSEGRKDFWSAVRNRYKRRDISRETVLALVDLGLRSTGGSYKTLAARFQVKEHEYHRFMDFLRRNDCLLDFRPYRKAAMDRA